MESFNLNIIPGKDRPVCHASQFDIGRQFHVNLFEGFNVFTLDGTETISLSVRKPDGNVVTASVTNTSDSYVEFVTTEQMTACEGSNLCELKLEKGSDVIGTANFILEVEVDPLEGGVQSASEIDNLQTQVAGMVAAEVADQYDSANVIFDAVPTAGHGVGYAVTSEGVKNELDPIKADVSGLQSDVGDLQTDVGNLQDDISDAYDDTATYSEGEIVIYDGVLYECTVTGGITTPESWNPTHWTVTTIKALLALKQNSSDNSLTTTNKTIVGAINEIESDITTVSAVTATFDTTKINSGGISAYKMGKLVFVSAYMQSNNGFAASVNFGAISVRPTNQVFFSSVGSNGQGTRLRLTNAGNLESEAAVVAGAWYSFSFMYIEA